MLGLSDPVRLANGNAAPTDGGPALGPDQAAPIPGQATFDEMLRAMNPLHHLPGVGMLYRAVTGEEIQPAFRVLGGALFGGVPGMLSAAAVSAVEQFDPVARMTAVLRGEGDPWEIAAGPPPTARQAALNAYGLSAYGSDTYGSV